MAKKEELQKEINELTDKIRQEKPGAYELLMESPETIPNNQDKYSDDFEKALKKYRNQLIGILEKDD